MLLSWSHGSRSPSVAKGADCRTEAETQTDPSGLADDLGEPQTKFGNPRLNTPCLEGTALGGEEFLGEGAGAGKRARSPLQKASGHRGTCAFVSNTDMLSGFVHFSADGMRVHGAWKQKPSSGDGVYRHLVSGEVCKGGKGPPFSGLPWEGLSQEGSAKWMPSREQRQLSLLILAATGDET